MSTTNANKVNVSVTSDETPKGVCKLIVLSQFSVPSPDSTSKNDTDNRENNLVLDLSNYENAFAIELAIKHLNEGNGSIIEEIESLKGTCDIHFEGEYIDTEDDATTAVKRVNSRLDQEKPKKKQSLAVGNATIPIADDYQYNPCPVLIGATSSYSESIQTSVVANMKGYSIVSGMNQGTALSHKSNFPRFARTIPSNFGPASAFVKYFREELAYKYLVILRTFTDHSNDYVSSLRKAISMHNSSEELVVREFFIQQDGTNVKEQIKKFKDLDITTVIAIFEGIEYRNNLYDVVMKEAHRQKVAGTGEHVWFFPESLLEYSQYLSREVRNSEENRDPSLYEAYKGAGIVKSGGLESKYFKLIDAIQEQSEIPKHMEHMESILPNPFSDTNINATRDEMNNESFLNKDLLDSRIQFLYEATVLVGLSACKASTDAVHLSGEEFYNTLVGYNFTGISGSVALDDMSGSRVENSTDYSIMNIRPRLESSNKYLELRHTSTVKSGELVVSLENFEYNDGTDKKPQAVWESRIETVVARPSIVYVTSFCCAISVGVCIFTMIWTYQNRNTRIIRASQPFFLFLISIGTMILALTTAPFIAAAAVKMTDDQGMICANLNAWCFFVGVSIIVSSFYCKLHRINKIMMHSRMCQRITVRIQDSILPTILAVLANLVVLILIAARCPYKIHQVPVETDQFGRISRVYQMVDFWSEHLPYTATLLAINFVLVVFALYEAWKAKDISTEFQENEAIGRSLLVFLLSFFLIFPVLFLTNGIEVRTFVLTMIITIMCLSIQGFLFGEKYLYQRKRTATMKIDDEAKEFTGEKILSNKTRQQLALENKELQEQMANSRNQMDTLRNRISERAAQTNQSSCMEKTSEDLGDCQIDFSSALSLSEPMMEQEQASIQLG